MTANRKASEPNTLSNVSRSVTHPETIVLNNPYVSCWWCNGSGVEPSLIGMVSCSECGGDCIVRDRDEKGRFITHPETWYHQGDGLYGKMLPETLPSNNGSKLAGGNDVQS